MKKQKTTKRALLLSALSLLLCMAMLVGSTFAWFTDSVTSGRNTIVSGQLDVNLYYATLKEDNTWTDYTEVDSDIKVFNENALYEPGYTEVVKFKVVNEGTLALKYSLDAKIYHETAGKNVYGETFNLSNYLYTGTLAAADYTREAAVAAATTQLSTGFNMKSTSILQANAAEELVLVLTMPTTVGNEANHVDGFQPKIDLGISLIATQATYEADDFDNLYDADATLPVNQAVTAPLAGNGADTVLSFSAPETKVPSFTAVVPAGAVAAGATELVLEVKEQANAAITVSGDLAATTYDISIKGIAANNDVAITVTMNIGAGLNSVKLYHNDELIPSSYDAATGALSFDTTGFSPYTVVYSAVDVITVANAAELQAALNAAVDGDTIVFTADIAGVVTVSQPDNKKVCLTIDGNGHKFDGTIKIFGNSPDIGNMDDTLLIKNVNFVTSTASNISIWSDDSSAPARYAHNVTIQDCTFTATGAAVNTASSVSIRQAYNFKLVGCTATNMHSLLQANSCSASTIVVDSCKVVDCKGGVSFNNTKKAVISNCEINAIGDGGYGVRHKGDGAFSLTVTNCEISAFVPVLVRDLTANGYVATMAGNTMQATNAFGYQVVLSAKDWDSDAAQPAAPTGTYVLDNANILNIFQG